MFNFRFRLPQFSRTRHDRDRVGDALAVLALLAAFSVTLALLVMAIKF